MVGFLFSLRSSLRFPPLRPNRHLGVAAHINHYLYSHNKKNMELHPSLESLLDYQHETIAQVIKNATPEDLTKEVSPGKWSVRDNIVHLYIYLREFEKRLELICTSAKEPFFKRYVADEDPQFKASRNMDVQKALAEYVKDRQMLYNTIMELPDDCLDKYGRHPKFGRLSTQQWIEFFLLHEGHHIFTIFQLVNRAD